MPSLHSSCVVTSEHRSLDPTEEENCLIMCHDDVGRNTDLDSNEIIRNNLHPKLITHAQTDRGDKPLVSTLNSGSSFSSLKKPIISSNLRSFTSTDDGSSLNETTVGVSSGYYSGTSDYSQSSYKAKIAGAGSSPLERSNLAGVHSEVDRVPYRKIDEQMPDINPDKLAKGNELDTQLKHRDYTIAQSKHNNHDRHVPTKHQHIQKPQTFSTTETANKVAKPNKTGYNKSTYTVLVGNCVKVYSTKFSSLPHHNKFMVKERIKETNKVKLILVSDVAKESESIKESTEDHVEKDGGSNDDCGEAIHFRENAKRCGYVIYTRDKNFYGNIKYPLPTGKATNSRIGKGGNGFVFTIYHEKRVYAVKKTVYRSNEVNVHSALKHKNILALLAVLIGEKHERHSGKLYCYHFMPKMDYDLRQVLSVKEVGCLKHYYRNCSKDPEKWEIGFTNLKFVLGEVLGGLQYLHANGYVHRDVKASNIMIKMTCQCKPLVCKCSSKFQVKLGDFDSAGTIPGLGITEPTDQIIKFASILPLGTPGYRAPEVSMHITLSGPYEILYTTAVDMWSFGCLCLNICIGKTAALKQREEASLLLSKTHPCSKELWEKTTKIKELELSSPFSNEKDFTNFIRWCLQVDSTKRPSAKDAIKAFTKFKKV